VMSATPARWSTVYARVSGDSPPAEAVHAPGGIQVLYVQSEVNGPIIPTTLSVRA